MFSQCSTSIYQAFDGQTEFSRLINFTILSYTQNSRKFDAREWQKCFTHILQMTTNLLYVYHWQLELHIYTSKIYVKNYNVLRHKTRSNHASSFSSHCRRTGFGGGNSGHPFVCPSSVYLPRTTNNHWSCLAFLEPLFFYSSPRIILYTAVIYIPSNLLPSWVVIINFDELRPSNLNRPLATKMHALFTKSSHFNYFDG